MEFKATITRFSRYTNAKPNRFGYNNHMNTIAKKPLKELGYGFIDPAYIPPGKDEYYLRKEQNTGHRYRKLLDNEIGVLEKNGNTASDWNDVLAGEKFNPDLVKNCRFYGLVRIGDLEDYYLEFHDLGLPVGLYNSTVISCDIGSNAAVHNVRHLSHYIIGDEVTLLNIDEMVTTGYAKFGNGMVKEGEPEDVRIWLEICNENGGRRVLPFEDMLPGDAYLWSKYRGDAELTDCFKRMSERNFDRRRGFYGVIGERCVIKDCRILKDVKTGTDCYIKGANKLKNLTIRSSKQMPSQIGEGCELVNGIIGCGCRIFYGVKAVRFILRDASSLKYGARLINSILGDNSTISCCEVLNSLIFPGHEQHHNNSFLCASTVLGQSNIAAGATIGSNHNSRGSDGELVAGRGFWPGLCVSLKHNSRFASYCLLAKGSYPAELDIPLPFSLISNDEQHGSLVVMPGYWFLYNMYAVARNAWKYGDRDKRQVKEQQLEFAFLAPDTAEELYAGLGFIEGLYAAELEEAGSSGGRDTDAAAADRLLTAARRSLIEEPEHADRMPLYAAGFEASKRPVRIIKAGSGYASYRRMLRFYCVRVIAEYMSLGGSESRGKPGKGGLSLSGMRKRFASARRTRWINAGGQLVPGPRLDALLAAVKDGSVASWQEVHAVYREWETHYAEDRCAHAVGLLRELLAREADCFREAAKDGRGAEAGEVDDGAAASAVIAAPEPSAGTAAGSATGKKTTSPEPAAAADPFDASRWTELLAEAVKTYRLIAEQTASSREKDYSNPFRKMTYGDTAEMEAVVGTFAQNNFIAYVAEEAAAFEKTAAALKAEAEKER